jgi:hypothetical protein
MIFDARFLVPDKKIMAGGFYPQICHNSAGMILLVICI